MLAHLQYKLFEATLYKISNHCDENEELLKKSLNCYHRRQKKDHWYKLQATDELLLIMFSKFIVTVYCV